MLHGRVLGIDYGTKRIGLALSDESSTVAFPYDILENKANAVERVRKVIKEKEVTRVVIGESRNHDGGENKLASTARSFGDTLLMDDENITVSYEQEFLSSVEADRVLYDAGVRGDTKYIDAHAATVILQRYLDKQNQSHE